MATLDLDFDLQLPAFTVSVALSVEPGTLALVGPSGAGKTTVLRAIAGLAAPDRGRIALGEETWFDAAARLDRPPEERSVGFVFQDYALFPHLSVRRNVAFGARAGGADVDGLLERFRVSHLAAAKPATLSGGERQRVALARALARRPAVLLLDEPFAALDAHTRALVRAELRELLDELALPTVFITHDYRDAAALAARAAVIAAGELRQVGAVGDLAREPADTFVATLTGNNVLAASAVREGATTVLVLDDGQRLETTLAASGPVGLAIAPWDARPLAPGEASGGNVIEGRVAALSAVGNRVEARVGPLAVECDAATAAAAGLRPGERARVAVPTAAIRLLG